VKLTCFVSLLRHFIDRVVAGGLFVC